MIQDNTEIVAKLVRDAMEWTPSEDIDKLLEKASKEEAKKNPIIARKCCRECAFLNPNDTCESFRSPEKLPKREPGEWIPIPRNLLESIYCEAWVEVQLAKLLIRHGYGPASIDYRRRHPKIEIPSDGLKNFEKYLASLPRQKAILSKEVEKGAEGVDWPIMDEGLKAILTRVEQRGDEEMWSQYQARLFLMDYTIYINSIFDRLVQKPDSKIGAFFRYVIDTHEFFYHFQFGKEGEQGAKTYERVVELLGHESKTIREIALQLLNAIAKHSYRTERPENSTDPNVWREWAKEEFRAYWGNPPPGQEPKANQLQSAGGLKRCKKGHANSPNAKVCWKCNEVIE